MEPSQILRANAQRTYEKAAQIHAKNERKFREFGKIYEASKASLEEAEQEKDRIEAILSGAPASSTPKSYKKGPTKAASTTAQVVAPTRKYTRKASGKATPVTKTTVRKASGKVTPVTKTAAKARQSEGRNEVREGKRPSLKNAMIKVMGNKVMTKVQVFEALKAKNWLPKSNNPLSYVGYALSAMKTKDKRRPLFERVAEQGRGHYRACPDELSTVEASTQTKPADKPAKVKATAKAKGAVKTSTKTRATKAASPETRSEANGATHQSADEILREAGVLETQAPLGA